MNPTGPPIALHSTDYLEQLHTLATPEFANLRALAEANEQWDVSEDEVATSNTPPFPSACSAWCSASPLKSLRRIFAAWKTLTGAPKSVFVGLEACSR